MHKTLIRPKRGQDLVKSEPGVPSLDTREQMAKRQSPGGTPWSNDHPVNIRLSIPLLAGRFYLTIVAGRERRSAERLLC